MRDFLITLLKLSILIILGFCLGIYFERSSSQTSFLPPTVEDPALIEREKIDSLKLVIDSLNSEKLHWKDSIQINIVTKEKELNKIKDLPIDSAVLYLQIKLRDFENI